MDHHYLVCRLEDEWHIIPEGKFRICRNQQGYHISVDGGEFVRIDESDYEFHSFKHAMGMVSDKNPYKTKKPVFSEAS